MKEVSLFCNYEIHQIVAENLRGIGRCLWCCRKDFDE
jgi:hypothetical protein